MLMEIAQLYSYIRVKMWDMCIINIYMYLKILLYTVFWDTSGMSYQSVLIPFIHSLISKRHIEKHRQRNHFQ